MTFLNKNKINLIVFFLVCFFVIFSKNILQINSITQINNNSVEFLAFTTLLNSEDSDNDFSYKITPSDFKKALTKLHENNYVLVDIFDVFEIKENKIIQNEIPLPNNKKPLVISFDNVSYKTSYQNTGEVDKIILDRNNNIATYTRKKNIQDRISYDNEFIPILETFIKHNPSFSHNNARGIIFLTGENGVLGYETNKKFASAKYDKERATEIVLRLKSLGWIFGCNNYTYKDISTLSDFEFIKELELWKEDIECITGKTQLYSYPYGVYDSTDQEKLSTLLNNDFNLLFTIGDTFEVEILNKHAIITQKLVTSKFLEDLII